ncbi:MAG TPA: hypothetical protein VN829_21270 [Dongiaceae bacterium]|nr:hypothetical protein [Dongiaceae bacterium]
MSNWRGRQMLHWLYWLFFWPLMGNRFCLVTGTCRANLAPAMKWLLGAGAMGDFTKPRTDPLSWS